MNKKESVGSFFLSWKRYKQNIISDIWQIDYGNLL